MDKYDLDESLVTRPNDYGFYYKYRIVERRQWFFVFRNCSSLKIRLSESLRDSNEKKERKEKKGKERKNNYLLCFYPRMNAEGMYCNSIDRHLDTVLS